MTAMPSRPLTTSTQLSASRSAKQSLASALTPKVSSALTPLLSSADCYQAMKARDARFDGSFFTAVTSTGIYCRPVCSVKTPKPGNCHFFALAAQAESAGFRPCLRCRPELAPHSVVWSIQDASYVLAHQAARLLDDPDSWAEPVSARKLAARLGISDRHLRRIFEAQLGVSPLQYLQTRRLHTAKQLLADTLLPITQIAHLSGYASLRRFNAEFVGHYHLNPSDLRKKSAAAGTDNTAADQGTLVRLGYRPPYDVAAMLSFFEKRCMGAIECVTQDQGSASFRRTFSVESAGQRHSGWLAMQFDEPRAQLRLRVSDGLRDALPLVIRRVRALLDLNANPAAINSVLQPYFPGGDGLRVPGTLDGFELAVRAVLGQQITVAAARTLAHRLSERFGEPIQTPWPGLTRLFPTALALSRASGDALGQLGIVRQRQAAITQIARAVVDRRLDLHGNADVAQTLATLKAMAGVGDWTAQYIAMRALRWPDAFVAGDVALHTAFNLRGQPHPARLLEAASQAWKPWRSYAVIRAWSGLSRAAVIGGEPIAPTQLAPAHEPETETATATAHQMPDTTKLIANYPINTVTRGIKDHQNPVLTPQIHHQASFQGQRPSARPRQRSLDQVPIMMKPTPTPRLTATRRYASPLGTIILAATPEGLSGLWFEGQRHFPAGLVERAANVASAQQALLDRAVAQLDRYFAGQRPVFDLPLDLSSGTPFQQSVWQALSQLVPGQTASYGEISTAIGKPKAVRAVGAAIGRNPISIIVPCHRVVGSKGQLTGYAGGLDKKTALLQLERSDGAPQQPVALSPLILPTSKPPVTTQPKRLP